MAPITRPTLSQTFLDRVRASPNKIGFQYKPTYAELGPLNQWKEVSFKAFYDEARIVSFGLMQLGVKPEDKVVILSNTRYEWSVCDIAILGASAITVPIYASNIADDVVLIAEHADARILFLEDSKQLQKILEKRAENPSCLPRVDKFIVMEPSAMNLAARYLEGTKNVITLQALKELGRREEIKAPGRFDSNLSAATPRDIMTICYTSGTTGVPKGVMLTHDNLMSSLEDTVKSLSPSMDPESETILSFLPFSHIFGKIESLAIYTFGWRQVFAENMDKLVPNIAEIRPTVLIAVPRIFEKAYNRIMLMVGTAGPAQKKLFHWAVEVGYHYYGAIWAGKRPSLKNYLEFQVAKKWVLNKVAQRFGGRLRYAVCGGAPLSKEIGEFFQIVGIQILEGYGLTETSAPVTVNTPDHIRFGTVGRPMPEVTLKIAEDGEILVKSRKVFSGYFKMPEETEQVLRAGWFYTGDIGYLDAEGYLHITDRKKDLIITSGGKNIAPQKIENIAKTQKLITEFVVHGDRRPYLTALITLDRDQIVRFANENQILFSQYKELVKNPRVLLLVQKVVDEVNKQLSSFETIKKFVILPEEFTVESGELTPSLKIKRNKINGRYMAELDSMYNDPWHVIVDSEEEIR